MQNRTKSLIIMLIGFLIGVWSYTRVTSFYGQMHSWEPPFEPYEIITIIGIIISIALLIIGIVKLTKKESDKRNKDSN